MKPLFLYTLIVGLLAPALAWASKVQFEQTSQVLVWDNGKLQGQVDSEDDLTDLTVPCSVDEGQQDSATFHNRSYGSSPEVQRLANALKTSLGITVEVNINPVVAVQGHPDKPIFFLFPEHHIQESPNALTLSLHESRAVDMARIVDELTKKNVKILNVDEGPAGTPWVKDLGPFPQEPIARLKQIFESLASHSMSGARLVGEAFHPEVQTLYSDNNDLWVRWVLAVLANEYGSAGHSVDKSWKKAREVLAGSSRAQVSHIRIGEYRPFFKNLFKSGSLGLKGIYSQLCESRSQKMAQFSFESAKAQGARVVLMSFGVVHAYGIIEQLKNYSANFILFSPNHGAK